MKYPGKPLDNVQVITYAPTSACLCCQHKMLEAGVGNT
jgi:hypothetical protein